jgi:predicted Zn-dependent peptidase
MKYLIITTLLFIVMLPASAQAPDRSAPPPLTGVKDLELPPIQRFELSNGVKVVLMEKHSVPLVQVNLLLQTGSVHDPAGKEGLGSITMDMLDEGAGKYSALELADEIEFLGTEITTYSGTFTSGINCLAPLSKLESSLALMADITLRPRFEATELERIRKLRLNGLLQNYDQPTVIASRAFMKYLFDRNSPYSKFPGEAAIRSVRHDDLAGYHKANVVTDNCTFIVVGDVTEGSIRPLLEQYFAGIPAGKRAIPPPPASGSVKKRTLYLVDKPGAAQSVIRIGKMGPARDVKAYYAITVMNTILGGSFASRLNTNLREEHGYSYGAGSFFYFWPVASPFVATSSVQTDVTAPALKEFFNEFDAILKSLPPDDLERGRNYGALGYAANFETNTGIADQLDDLVVYNLPDDYFNNYVRNILGVAAPEVEGTAREYIRPGELLVIVVGDRAKIEKGIRDLNLGTLKVLSVEDVLGKKPKAD